MIFSFLFNRTQNYQEAHAGERSIEYLVGLSRIWPLYALDPDVGDHQSGIILETLEENTKPNLFMKVILCVMLMCTGINQLLVAQTSLPTAGPSFSSKDTTKAAVIAVASMQAYPTGIDRQTTRVEPKEIIENPTATKTADQGPIRDWSNPPGYMGSRGQALPSSKHKPLTPQKYHRPKSSRCYTF